MTLYPNPERRFYDIPGGRLSAVHFGRTSNPLKLLFLHATGFNGYTYKSILEPLGVHAMAIDMRGHGMSELPTDIKSLKSWHIFRDDVVAFLQNHLKRPVILAGHSCGATVAMMTAAACTEKVSGVVAFDPVTMPVLARLWPHIPGGRAYMKARFPLAKKAGNRRAVFANAEAVFRRYHDRGTFKGVSDSVLRDYITGGTKLHPVGVELACAPKWEQAVFTAQGQNIFKATKAYSGPKRIIYAGKYGPSIKSTRRKMEKIVGPDNFKFHKDYAHFFPLQKPEVAVEAMDAMIKRVALNR